MGPGVSHLSLILQISQQKSFSAIFAIKHFLAFSITTNAWVASTLLAAKPVT
jgi:hypothetical protein